MNHFASSNWRPDVAQVDLIAEDGATVTLPVGMLDGLHQMAWRVMAAHANGQNVAPGEGWAKMNTLPALSARTGTMVTQEGPRVVLMLDPRTDVAINFHLTAEMARDMARGLVECADIIEAEAAAMGKGH